MREKITFTLIWLALFFACKTDTGNSSEDKEKLFKATLACEVLNGNQDQVQSGVFLLFNDNKIKIANISSCETIEPERFEQYKIPALAQSACGGWWAGAGDYFYLIKDQDSYLVYQGFVAEELSEEESYRYKPVYQLNDEGKLVSLVNLQDFNGVYTLGGHDTSWMIVLKESDKKLQGRFIRFDGMLPPPDYLKANQNEFQSKMIQIMELDPYHLSFNSELGSGFIEQKEGVYQLSFLEKDSHLDDILILRADPSYDQVFH